RVLGEADDRWQLRAAGGAPCRPDVQEDRAVLELREFDGRIIQVAKRPRVVGPRRRSRWLKTRRTETEPERRAGREEPEADAPRCCEDRADDQPRSRRSRRKFCHDHATLVRPLDPQVTVLKIAQRFKAALGLAQNSSSLMDRNWCLLVVPALRRLNEEHFGT